MSEFTRTAAPPVILKIPKGWPGPLAVDGGFDEYTFPAARIEEYSVVEQHLLKNRISPIDAVLPQLEKLARKRGKGARRLAEFLSDRAYQDLRANSKELNRLSVDDVTKWMDSPEGALFTMKLCMQRVHPTISDAEVRRCFEWMGSDEYIRLRDMMSGTDALGNSTGPAPKEETVAGPSTGESSTDSSPPSTPGHPGQSTDSPITK